MTGASTRDDDSSAFLLILSYTRPLEQIEALLPAHRRWLDQHYAAGTFLASGPRVPREGGVILARGATRADLEVLTRSDPFAQAGVAAYELVEFRPNRGPFAAHLVGGAASGSDTPPREPSGPVR